MSFSTINKQVLLTTIICSIIIKASTKLFPITVKLIEYIFSAVSVCSNPGAGAFPRIKMFFFLLSTCTGELISTPKLITLLPNTPPANENARLL